MRSFYTVSYSMSICFQWDKKHCYEKSFHLIVTNGSLIGFNMRMHFFSLIYRMARSLVLMRCCEIGCALVVSLSQLKVDWQLGKFKLKTSTWSLIVSISQLNFSCHGMQRRNKMKYLTFVIRIFLSSDQNYSIHYNVYRFYGTKIHFPLNTLDGLPF